MGYKLWSIKYGGIKCRVTVCGLTCGGIICGVQNVGYKV